MTALPGEAGRVGGFSFVLEKFKIFLFLTVKTLDLGGRCCKIKIQAIPERT